MNEKAQQNREFEALIEFIRTDRGFDFTGYKRPSLARRIGKRMEAHGIEGYADYLAFFRDEVAWEFLREEIAPRLLLSRDGVNLRVCSTV